MIPNQTGITLIGGNGTNERNGERSNPTKSLVSSDGTNGNNKTTSPQFLIPTPDNSTGTITYKISFDITGENASVSVLKNSISSAQFFPKVGNSEYVDSDGTTYRIRSSNTDLYKIDRISVISSAYSTVQTYQAKDNESLNLKLTLSADTYVSIKVDNIQQIKVENPVISLENNSARNYNINSESGVPLLVNKNEDVKVITAIIGDDVMEFDELDEGDLCGITIPSNIFENIGKYNIKLYPFSLDNYNQDVEPATQISTRKVAIPANTTVTETKDDSDDGDDDYNPYTPPRNRPKTDGGQNGTNDALTDPTYGRPGGNTSNTGYGGFGSGNIRDRNPFN